MPHQYAEHGDAFPGSMGQGATAQSIGQPQILAQAEVGKAAVRRADAKPAARANRKSTRRPRRT